MRKVHHSLDHFTNDRQEYLVINILKLNSKNQTESCKLAQFSSFRESS